MIRHIALLLALVVAVAPVRAQSDCTLVYGDSWAFTFATPDQWRSLCGAEEKVGAPLALWPTESTFRDAEAVMYINVSAQDPEQQSLQEFVRFSQEQFKSQAPSVVFLAEERPTTTSKLNALHFSASGDPGGNHELLVYVEGPSAFFILVLSARTQSALDKWRPSFLALYQSFAPMAATMQ